MACNNTYNAAHGHLRDESRSNSCSCAHFTRTVYVCVATSQGVGGAALFSASALFSSISFVVVGGRGCAIGIDFVAVSSVHGLAHCSGLWFLVVVVGRGPNDVTAVWSTGVGTTGRGNCTSPNLLIAISTRSFPGRVSFICQYDIPSIALIQRLSLIHI